MATRIGIELSPDAYRIAEIDLAPAWGGRGRETRVRSFVVLPPSGPETEAKLRSLRHRRAAVVVWNAASDHRQVMVSPGSYESMRAEAIAALDAAGVETRSVWVDIAPAIRTTDRAARRPVVVTLASGPELTVALRPLLEAGIRVQTVMTPAAALSSLARLRRDSSTPDALEVFVALEERATCIALMRGGVLLAARDLGWGYIDEFGTGMEPRARDDTAARLGDAITEFVAATGGAPGDISQVCVCGGHPELRSMTAPLMMQLDVEAEPFDSLFGIDAERLPEPADEFRERAAELRLAWAAAADSPPTFNLLRARNRQASKTMLVRVAVGTGVAAALAIGWRTQGQGWRSTAPAATLRSAANLAPGARRATPVPATPVRPATASNAPPVAPSKTPPTMPPPAIANAMPIVPPPVAASRTPPVVPPPVAANRMPPVVPPQPSITNRAPSVVPPPVSASNTPPGAPPPPAIGPPPIAPREEPRQQSAVVRPTLASAARDSYARLGQEPVRARRAGPPPEVARPFEGLLGTILYSPDRKLAIIDGRIVSPGDEIRGARVVDITPGTVILRDGLGHLRHLTMTSRER